MFQETDAAAFLTNHNVFLPPNYYTFTPPANGGNYVDPVFGTTITRISDAAATTGADSGQPLPWVETEYSTKSPFNVDNSRILLLEFGYFSVYNGATLQRIKPLCCQGTIVSAQSEPLWSRTDPNVFYFHPSNPNQPTRNRLQTYNVATDGVTLLHTFTEYSSIFARGESEMSYDGDHLVLAGDGHQIFVYTISTNTKGPLFETNGKNPNGWDAVYISPDNNVLIAWRTNGNGRFQGEELYDKNMNFLRKVANNDGHKHMTRDVDGSEVLVQTNSADPTPIPNCMNGFVKINLATTQQTCLLQLDFSLLVHVSAPDQSGWIFAQTHNDTTASSPWFAYTNELLQIKLDGTEVRRLGHHRSDTSTYDGEPHISVSRDGSRFAFNSNMMGSTTDVYVAAASAGLDSISPNTAEGSPLALTVTGTNFWSGSVVRWNGATRPTTFVSKTQLIASISAADLTNGGTALVTVFNPVLGGATSNALGFTVTKKRRSQLISD